MVEIFSGRIWNFSGGLRFFREPRKQLGTTIKISFRFRFVSIRSADFVDHDMSSRTDSLKVTVLVWKTVQFKDI